MANSTRGLRSYPAREAPLDLVKEIIFQIRRLVQAGELYSKELSKKYSVTSAQLNCLIALYENGPLPPSQIAKIIMVKSSTVTGIIDRLENKGLVVRLRKSPDRRVITIQLTEAGKKLADSAPPPIQQQVLDGLQKLPSADVGCIVKGLRALTHMLDAEELEVG
jgi:DNA-binding MarR family transcriptional regulator